MTEEKSETEGRRRTDSAGAVVFRGRGEGAQVLLIATRGERCSFPKGHIEPGESPEAAAVREIREETGVTAALRAGFLACVPSARPGDRRRVFFFLADWVSGEPVPQPGEIKGAFWCPADRAAERITYPPDREAYLAAVKARNGET